MPIVYHSLRSPQHLNVPGDISGTYGDTPSLAPTVHQRGQHTEKSTKIFYVCLYPREMSPLRFP